LKVFHDFVQVVEPADVDDEALEADCEVEAPDVEY
jgi:hypothetical protein